MNRVKTFLFFVGFLSTYLVPRRFWGDLKYVVLENAERFGFLTVSQHEMLAPLIQSTLYGTLLSLIGHRQGWLGVILFFVLTHNTLGLHQFNLLAALVAMVLAVKGFGGYLKFLAVMFHPSVIPFAWISLTKRMRVISILVVVLLIYFSLEDLELYRRWTLFESAQAGELDLSYAVRPFNAKGHLHWLVLLSSYLVLLGQRPMLATAIISYLAAYTLSDFVHSVILERMLQLHFYVLIGASLIEQKSEGDKSLRVLFATGYLIYFGYYVSTAY